MQFTRLGALDQGQPFLVIDQRGVAGLLRVHQPAWDGPGEGTEVKARRFPVSDPAALGLDLMPILDLADKAMYLSPGQGGWRLYRVNKQKRNNLGTLGIEERIGQEWRPAILLDETIHVYASRPKA